MNDLNERQKAYEDAYNYQIIKRLPIVVRIEIRNFKKLTEGLKKPFSPEIMDAMAHTLLYVITEISGAIFGYHKENEINIIIRQDDEVWLQNNIQKISSTSASLATLAFNRFMQALDLDGKELASDAIFSAVTFGVPSIKETVNYLINRQTGCIINSIHDATYNELSNKLSPHDAFNMLQKKNSKTKQDILLNECDIDFEDYYPIPFRRGICAYKAPSIKKDVDKYKWIIDLETPLFISSKDWLENILRSGRDIFRARDFIGE